MTVSRDIYPPTPATAGGASRCASKLTSRVTSLFAARASSIAVSTCAVGAVAALVGCVTVKDPVTGTQSLRVEMTSPASPGSPDMRLDPSARTITVNLTALDEAGETDASYTSDVQVYAQFLGTLTPAFDGVDPPLATIHVTNGVAMNQHIDLPPVFGPTTLWIDDARSDKPTYATGTSPTLWYPDPFIKDLQTPKNEMGLDALSASPLQDKQIAVNASRYGARGRLVVTSVFAQGYTVSDVQCADANGAPPCTAQAYDHAMVFSFSAPRDQKGRLIEEGQLISGFAGGASEFNGLTEIGFPQSFADDDVSVNKMREPAPVKLDPATWFRGLNDPQGMINFERNEAGAIEIDGGVVCDLDGDFDTYKQWKLDPSGTGGDCSGNKNVINIITAGISAIDPTALVGKALTKVVGILRPVSIGSFNVWIIYPRDADDVKQ